MKIVQGLVVSQLKKRMEGRFGNKEIDTRLNWRNKMGDSISTRAAYGKALLNYVMMRIFMSLMLT
ncbi:MAG: hypothetical protein ACLU6Y_20290 [Ruminococcus sp.]